jgi:SAM-dependent methyltransferase
MPSQRSVGAAALNLVPHSVRQLLARAPLLSRLSQKIKTSSRYHDVFYTPDYYQEDVTPAAAAAAPAVVGEMIRRFRPTDVLDVGCGTGEYLAQFDWAGIPATGLELAKAALEACRAKALRAVECDLTSIDKLPVRAELVYSFEVAEHLPEAFAASYVRLLCEAADRWVVLTAAGPGQRGVNHFNCQPKSYWAALFEAHGLQYQPEIVSEWEAGNAALGLPPWFAQNLLVFRVPEPRGATPC